ncbi:MAG: hypothetical protein PSV16_11555 [Flavobacterium sp.]|nr:hypothetical protein [Flavobacterium sp.]
MKAKRRFVIQYFLRTLQLRMQLGKNPEEINPVFLKIYDKQELKGIVKWIFNKKIPEGMDLDKMDEEELLETISDEQYILGYLLSQLEEELQGSSIITQESVWATLEQLGLQTHYLARKAVAQWEAYDHANYRALCAKAGKFLPLYGIYDSGVEKQDKYLTIPGRIYDTECEAQEALSKFFTEGGQFHDGDLKIMRL